MEFTLVYEGPLKPHGKGGSSHRQDIRSQFNEQLKVLWEAEPLKSHMPRALGDANIDYVETFSATAEGREPRKEPSTVREVSGNHYLPIVAAQHSLTARIDITWFRDEPPGKVLQIGDIDNRLKTLLDCLQTPPVGQATNEDLGTSLKEPFFTVLDDDALISEFSVKTVRDLRTCAAQGKVLLMIQVRPIVVASQINNQPFM